MTAANQRLQSFRHFLLGTLLLLIAAAVALILDETWFEQRLKRSNLEGLLTLTASHEPPEALVLVEIDQEDFRDLFKRISPLDHNVTCQLIRAIGAGGASAIGIDILTNDWHANWIKDLPRTAPIVWVQEASEIERPAGSGQPVFYVDPIMGKEAEAGLLKGPSSVIDIDGMTWQYQRYLHLADGRTVPSLTTLLTNLRRSATGSMASAEFINYTRTPDAFRRYTAQQILQASRQPSWGIRGPLDGRIVVLGATFKEAKDRHATPLGSMYGLEVLANILVAELSDRRIKEAPTIAYFLADLLLGIAILWSALLIPTRWRTPVTLTCTPFIAIFANLSLFYLWRFYLSFAPMALGVSVHMILEHVRDYRSLRKAQTELQIQYANLQLRYQGLQRECITGNQEDQTVQREPPGG